MKTYMATPSTIERKWYVVDAADKTLGRLAAEVAKVLRGKHKPTFTPHMDTGDHVIIINADKVRLTGKKLVQKFTSVTPVIWAAINILKQAICLPRIRSEWLNWPFAEWFPTIVWAAKSLKNCMYTLVLNILMLHKSLKF